MKHKITTRVGDQLRIEEFEFDSVTDFLMHREWELEALYGPQFIDMDQDMLDMMLIDDLNEEDTKH